MSIDQSTADKLSELLKQVEDQSRATRLAIKTMQEQDCEFERIGAAMTEWREAMERMGDEQIKVMLEARAQAR